jgi:xanthine dehydrogenase accessory factor
MEAEFAAENRPLSDADRERIYTPIGLNVGGDTPYESAFSIVGELLTVANGREPAHLSRREEPIHEREPGETT